MLLFPKMIHITNNLLNQSERLITVSVTFTATNNETEIIKSYNSSIITQQSINL